MLPLGSPKNCSRRAVYYRFRFGSKIGGLLQSQNIFTAGDQSVGNKNRPKTKIKKTIHQKATKTSHQIEVMVAGILPPTAIALAHKALAISEINNQCKVAIVAQ